CLRDYLYVPLGGSRDGERRTYRNLMITMLLGGLWHGAQWTFVVWGGYHGLLLILYRRYQRIWDRAPECGQRGAMFLLAVVGWRMFRATNCTQAGVLLQRMLIPHDGSLPIAWATLASSALVAAWFAHFGPGTFQLTHRWRPVTAAALTAVFALCLVRI